MARAHGKEVRVYLGSQDISDRLTEVSPVARIATHDRTTFGDAGDKTADTGLRGWEAGLSGLFDAADADTSFESLFGTTSFVLTVVDGDANAVGDPAPYVLPAGVLSEQGRPMSIADLIRRSAQLQGNGRAGLAGRLLHVKGAETITGVSASHDNSASSANGGRANVHFTAISGTWTVKVQHSSDDSNWVDLITFTAATAVGAESLTVTGTVNRYVRATFTEDVAGTATFVVAFARF